MLRCLPTPTTCWLCLAAWALSAHPLPAADAGEARSELARLIAGQLKSRSGLALDVGCGDASLAMAVARQADLVITCVEPHARAVEPLRRAIAAAGLYGTRVSVVEGGLAPLEFPDRCANLVLCGDEFVRGKNGRDFKEIFRVLSPNGIAWIGQGSAAARNGQPLTRRQLEDWLQSAGITSFTIIEKDGVWARITRPQESGWDEWTHRSHDPSNTFASRDRISGKYFKPQWISDFRPGLSSAAVAISGGKIVLASLAYEAYPETTPHIQVLDAYSGMELWAKVGRKELPIDRRPTYYSNRESCSDMAVVGNDLYLLAGKVCLVYDLETGQQRRVIPMPAEAQPEDDEIWLYMSCIGDVLYGSIGKPPGVRVDWNTMLYRGVSRRVFALDRHTGKLRWLSETPVSTCSISIGGGQLYGVDPDLRLHALDLKTGAAAWSSQLNYPPGTEIAGCAYYRDKVWLLYNRPRGKDRKGDLLRGAALLTAGHNARELDAYSADRGEFLFSGGFGTTVAGVSFSEGLVFGSGQHGGEGVAVIDADTGVLKGKVRESLKCTPSLASPNLFLSQRGAYPSILNLESLGGGTDLSKAARFFTTGFRPSCSFPGIPANGMIYHQSEGCACASPIRGNIALAPGQPAPFDNRDRLVRGPAFDRPLQEIIPAWASWRADVTRSGRTREAAPADLERLWTRKVPGEPTPLAAAGGLVYCGSSDHQVHALDAATGEPRWQRICAGRINTAPFLWRGRLYCSDDAGWVYCLAGEDGELAWQFRAALGRERMIGYGGFMSRWPARAGVLVHDDTAYFAAGLFPDEGTAVYAVDPRSGEVRWEREFNTNRKGSRTGGFVPDGNMALANGRLYVASGSGIPWQIELNSEDHSASFTPGTHVKGHHIMVADQDLLAVTPGLQYVHHVIYKDGEAHHRLPVVTEDTVYQLNQLSGKSRYLAAGKRADYKLSQNRASIYLPVKRPDAGPEHYLRWKAWKNEIMTTAIEAGGTLFSGGRGKVYATATADGKELWSAEVPGVVADLAFHGGRLFVLSDSGEITCFGRR